MVTEIIVAVIAAAGGLLGSLIGMVQSTNLINYRLEQLEKKVDKHNNLVERTYNLEERLSIQEERTRVANHRIDDLEREE